MSVNIDKTVLSYDSTSTNVTWKTRTITNTTTGDEITVSVPVKFKDVNNACVLFIGHEAEDIETTTDAGAYMSSSTSDDTDTVTNETTTSTVIKAMSIPVSYPVTRAKAIDAAESVAYGLRSAEETASFTASLARKARLGEAADEVTEHDEFIVWVKSELTAIGIR